MHSEDELSDEAVEVIACDAPSQYEMAPRVVEHKGKLAAGTGEVTPGGDETKKRGRGRPPRNNAGEELRSLSKGRRGRGQGSGGRGGGGEGGGGGGGSPSEFENGNPRADYNGRVLIPYLISVNAGDDICDRIVRFLLEQMGGVVYVICASGAVSNVNLRRVDDMEMANTYVGHFEILSLSGCFLQRDGAWSGGMSISVSGADGRVLGGGINGNLRAATHVQVVLGTLPPHDTTPLPPAPPAAPSPGPGPGPSIQEFSSAGRDWTQEFRNKLLV